MERNLVPKLHLLLLTSAILMFTLIPAFNSLALTEIQRSEQATLTENQLPGRELLSTIDFLMPEGNGADALSQPILVFSMAGQVRAIDLTTGITFDLGAWAGKYDYEIEFNSLQNLYGGKTGFSVPNLIDDPLLGDVYRTLQSPFDPGRVIYAYISNITETGSLIVMDNNVEKKRVNVSDLGIQFPVLPVGWLSSQEVLVGEYILGGGHCIAYYILNIETETLTKVPLTNVLGYHLTAIVGSKPNTLLTINFDNKLVEISLETFTDLRQWEVEAEYLWGWLKPNDITDFQQELTEFNERRLSQLGTPPFLYWPVPSNHEIACEIGCYPGHVGTDIGTSTNNDTSIYATSYGIVISVDNTQPYGYYRALSPTRGNYVHIRHDNDYYTAYYHMTTDIQVSVGQRVVPGTLLGYGSNSGYTCGTQPAQNGCLGYPGSYYHLHFEVQGSCGSSACWIDPFAENLWFRNGDGSITDPPPPDTTTPTVSITSGPEEWETQSTVTFSWIGADNQTPIEDMLYRYRLVGVTDWTGWIDTTSNTFLNLGDSSYLFEVQSRDLAWYESEIASQNFGVDITNPTNPTTISAGCTAVHNVWQNSCTNPAFTWSGASDGNGSGVQDYHIYWGTAPSGIPDTWRSTADFDPPTITPSGNVATYYLRVATRDNVGHESTPTTLFILRYDNSTPTGDPLVNGGAETVYNMNVTVQPQGSDTGSGVAKVHLSNDGVQWQTITSETAVSWSLLGLNRAWNPLWMQLEDGAGNRSPIYQQQVCLDIYPAHPSSTSFRLWSAGPTIAGGTLSSSNFQLTQSVGQTGSSAVFSSNSFQLQSGFSLSPSSFAGTTLFTPFSCGQSVYLPIVIQP